MQTFEKLSDYKRALKSFIRGAIKAKVFANAEGKYAIEVTRCENDKSVDVVIDNGTYAACFSAQVSTRTYNKITEALFEPITTQFSKLKGVGGFDITVA